MYRIQRKVCIRSFFYIDRKEMRIMMKVREVFHGCA